MIDCKTIRIGLGLGRSRTREWSNESWSDHGSDVGEWLTEQSFLFSVSSRAKISRWRFVPWKPKRKVNDIRVICWKLRKVAKFLHWTLLRWKNVCAPLPSQRPSVKFRDFEGLKHVNFAVTRPQETKTATTTKMSLIKWIGHLSSFIAIKSNWFFLELNFWGPCLEIQRNFVVVCLRLCGGALSLSCSNGKKMCQLSVKRVLDVVSLRFLTFSWPSSSSCLLKLLALV